MKNLVVNEGLLKVPIYVPGKSVEAVQEEYGVSEVIKLASNENPMGPSPKAIQAVAASLEQAHQIALETGLNYVYIGNVPGHKAENTYCHKCKEIVVGRIGYTITQMNLNNGKCKFCGELIPGVWG